MSKANTVAPDEALKDLIYIGEDGYLYWYDVEENKRRIRSLKGSTRVGANFTRGYPCISYNGSSYKVHRIIWWIKTGEWVCGDKELDHINRNTTDYRLSNLRVVTKQENQINKSCAYRIKSKTLKDGNISYLARIAINRKSFNVGTFKDELTALYAAWKIREILYPGILPMPVQLKGVVNA